MHPISLRQQTEIDNFYCSLEEIRRCAEPDYSQHLKVIKAVHGLIVSPPSTLVDVSPIIDRTLDLLLDLVFNKKNEKFKYLKKEDFENFNETELDTLVQSRKNTLYKMYQFFEKQKMFRTGCAGAGSSYRGDIKIASQFSFNDHGAEFFPFDDHDAELSSISEQDSDSDASSACSDDVYQVNQECYEESSSSDSSSEDVVPSRRKRPIIYKEQVVELAFKNWAPSILYYKWYNNLPSLPKVRKSRKPAAQ